MAPRFFFHTFNKAFYHKWDFKNDSYVLQLEFKLKKIIVFVTQNVWKMKDRKYSNHSLFPFTPWYLHKYPFFDAVCIFCIWHIYAMVGLLHLIMQGKQINMRVFLFPIP